MALKAFAIQARGFGDDENEWENTGVALSLRVARKTVVRMQKEWDEQDGEDGRAVRSSIYWRPTYRYEELAVVEA